MKTVSSYTEIEENVSMLNSYLDQSYGEEYEFAIGLIKAGRCFVVIKSKEKYFFYPSRFIGYCSNTMHLHQENMEKDGRITNKAINRILHGQPVSNKSLEEEYQKYCHVLNVVPYNHPHTFWKVISI